MARTSRSVNLESKTARLKLAAGARHSSPLSRGLVLIYRRPLAGQAGLWSARWQDKAVPVDKMVRLGAADDYLEADGLSVLSYQQAEEEAEAWFREETHRHHLIESGELVHAGPYTVADAWRDYMEAAKLRGVKGVKNMEQCYQRHVAPHLGDIEAAKLTRAKLEQWKALVAATPRRTNGKEDRKPAPMTEDQQRARKDSTNRILSNVKAALNFAAQEGKVSSGAMAWRLVKPFPKTSAQRVRFLSAEEQRKLVAACDDDLRPLVMAALYTGARYGELVKVQVGDFLGDALLIRWGKSKGVAEARKVILLPEAIKWFKSIVKDRPKDELLFKRTGAVRTREDLQGYEGWHTWDQLYAMDCAVERAGIERVTFHELRHTYATSLLNAGIPVAYVAKQLGHHGTRMCERHYGHLIEADMRRSLMEKAPVLGLGKAAKRKK